LLKNKTQELEVKQTKSQQKMSSLLGSLTVLISASTVGFAKAARDIRMIDRAVTASTTGMAGGVAATGVAVRKTGEASAQAAANTAAAARQANASLMSVGRTMTQFITLPLGILGIVAAKTFSDFEYSLAKITGLVGIASDMTARWGEQVLKMSANVGKGPTELADALYFITSSGFKTSESLDILNISAKAAASGLGETKVVANVVTSALNAYKQSNLDAAKATDILVNTVREGKGEADQMVASMGVILPISSKLGVSFDQVGAAMAAMTRTGSTAQTSAVQLRQILFTLLKPAHHTTEALKAMGTSSAELRKTLRDDGLLAVLMKVKNLIDTFGEETAGEIFPNIRALSGTLELIGENLEDNKKIFESLANSAGMADAAFEAVADTYKFKVRAALAEGSVMMVRFGEGIARVLIPVLENLQGAFKNVGNWFNNLSDSTQNFIVKTAGLVVAVGPVLALVSAFRSMYALVTAAKIFTAATMAQTAATEAQTAASEKQIVPMTQATNSAFRKALADNKAAIAAERLSAVQGVQVATTQQAATAQVRAEMASFKYAKAQMAAGEATAFASRTQQFATKIQASHAMAVANAQIIAKKAADAAIIASTKAAAAQKIFLKTQSAGAITTQALYKAQLVSAEASALAKQKLTIAQKAETLSTEASLLAKQAELAATNASLKAKDAEAVMSYKQRRATALAAAAARAEAVAMEASAMATIAATKAKSSFIAATEASLLFGKQVTANILMEGMALQTVAAQSQSAIIAMNGVNVSTVSASKAALMNARAQARQAAATRMATAALEAQAAVTKQATIASGTFTAYSGGSLLMAKNAQFAAKAMLVQNVAMVGADVTIKKMIPKVGLLSRAFTALGASMVANPWTWVIGAGIAVYALYKHFTKLTEVQELQKKLIEDTAEATATETSQLTSYLAIAQNEYVSRTLRLDAIKKLQAISPAYLSGISEETIRTGQAKIAIDAYITSLTEKYRLQGAQQALIEWEKEYTKSVLDGNNKRVDAWQKAQIIYSKGLKAMPTSFGNPLAMGTAILKGKKEWDKTIAEKQKENAQNAKAIYEEGKRNLLNELVNRKAVTENIATQFDFLQGKVKETITQEKEYQGLIVKGGKDRANAIAKMGEEYAVRLRKGGKGNLEADLIKEIGKQQQDVLIATVVELEGLLNTMQDEKKAIEKSLGVLSGKMIGKNQPAYNPMEGFTKGVIAPVINLQSLEKVNTMIGSTQALIKGTNSLILEPDVNLEEASFSLVKFNKDLKDIFTTFERESKLFGDYDIFSEKVKMLEKALKDVAAAKDVNINSEWVQQLVTDYNATKVLVAGLKEMEEVGGRSVTQFEAQLEAEYQAQQATDDLASSLMNAEVLLSTWDLSMQGMTNSTYDAVAEFEELEKIIKELEKKKGFLSNTPIFQGMVSTGAPMVPPTPMFKPSQKARFETAKSGAFDMDMSNVLKEMNIQFDTAFKKSEALKGVWNGLDSQISVLENSLSRALNVDLVNATDEQFKKWAKTIKDVTAELEKVRFSNSLTQMTIELERAKKLHEQFGDGFDYVNAQMQAYGRVVDDVFSGKLIVSPENVDLINKIIAKFKELEQGTIDWSNVLSQISSVFSSLKSIFDEVFGMDNPMSKFFEIIGKGVNLVSNLISVFKTLSDLSVIFKLAKNAETASIIANGVAQVSAATAGGIANTALSATEAGLAVSGAVAAGAWVPFPGNIAAISAGIAAVMTGLGTIPIAMGMTALGLKEGGLIPGGYPNDTFPAMLSSGELVIPEDRAKEVLNVLNSITKAKGQANNFVNKNNNFEKVLHDTKTTELPKMKLGGTIPQGYPNDSYPAWLSSGERILPPKEYEKLERAPIDLNITIEGKTRGTDLHYIVKEVERKYKNSH
jgi:hypothetical protein